jgi:hypothetical protein
MENVLVRTCILCTDLPARSRLYRLAPMGVGTPMVECLTSYVNRLAWMYRVNPRLLVAQEIIPNLGGSFRLPLRQLGPFALFAAMSINGIGEIPVDWSATLERLTMLFDLRYLNIHLWASELPTRGLMRETPAWCSMCYQDWRNVDLPIYQPLVWMLQVVTICLKHRQRLEVQCPNCQRRQAIIGSSVLPGGHCTQCRVWLGTPSSAVADNEIDDNTFEWQKWVIDNIEDLRLASTTTGLLQWGNLRASLNVCRKIIGGGKNLSRITNIPKITLQRWIAGKIMPSFESLLKLCYALYLSPLQLITCSSWALEEAMRVKRDFRPPRSRRPAPLPKKQEHTLEFIQAVLDGREAPQSARQIERQLDLGENTLEYHYPLEKSLVITQYRAYRAEQARRRLDQIRSEVRTATFSLHAQGVFPSQGRVSAMLSNPNWMRVPEAQAAWHAARYELGLEE